MNLKASPGNPGIGLRMVAKPGPDDRLLQVFKVISEDGRRKVATGDSRVRQQSWQHRAAVDWYLEGEASPYAQFQGQVRRRCRWGNNTPGGRGGVGGFSSEKGEVSSSFACTLCWSSRWHTPGSLAIFLVTEWQNSRAIALRSFSSGSAPDMHAEPRCC